MTGLPATDDVLSLILRIYRRDSELDKMLFDRAVPLLNVGGVSQEHWDTFVGRQLQRPHEHGTGRHHRAVYRTVGTAFQAQAEALARDEASVREIALPHGAAAVRRGRVRRVQGHRQDAARHAACQLRPAQRQRGSLCWKLAARWIGAKEDGIEAKYNESYDVGEATVKIKGQTPAKEGQG